LPGATGALEQAIRSDRIELRFQPQIEPASGRIAGVEALARWDEVDSPEQLFARADAGRAFRRLSRAIQRKALRTFAAWRGPLAASACRSTCCRATSIARAMSNGFWKRSPRLG
jgi:EAL domain-containing protein (putative c-di-GMP-specific phosphodiesterase class I)